MFKRKKRPNVELNVTSMVDIVLQLVLFFMVSTTFVVQQSGMKILLPQVKVRETQPIRDLMISVNKEGNIYLDRDAVTLDNLGNKLKSISNIQEKNLIIYADKMTYHGTVVTIMDIAKTNGIQKIAIATEQKAK